MQTLSIPSARTYFSLTKPGILFGNAITAAAGFTLASKGDIQAGLLVAMLLGLILVMASGCVGNNYIDRFADERMKRTQNRPLVKGLISTKRALIFALFLGAAGALCLAFFVNFLAATVALFGLFAYVILYSFSKYHTTHGTLIGSIAGAVPPVVGYSAVSHQLDSGAWILFAIVMFWQMPHFFAIGIYRLEDYAAAGIPIVPVKKGIVATKIQMLLYIIAFIGASSLPFIFGYLGTTYLVIALLLGSSWLCLAIKGFGCNNDALWARKMFIFSLIVIMGLSVAIPFTLT